MRKGRQKSNGCIAQRFSCFLELFSSCLAAERRRGSSMIHSRAGWGRVREEAVSLPY